MFVRGGKGGVRWEGKGRRDEREGKGEREGVRYLLRMTVPLYAGIDVACMLSHCMPCCHTGLLIDDSLNKMKENHVLYVVMYYARIVIKIYLIFDQFLMVMQL